MKNQMGYARWTFRAVFAFILVLCTVFSIFAEQVASDSGKATVDEYTLNYTWVTSKERADPNSTAGEGSNGGASVTLSGSTFTLKADSSVYKAGFLGIGAKSVFNYTAMLTITNSGTSGCTVHYKTTGSLGEVDTYVDLAPGGSLLFSLANTAKSTDKTSQELSGTVQIIGIAVKQTVNVDMASSPYGAYSYVAGSNDSVNVAANAQTIAESITAGGTVTMTAGTAASNYQFYGWMANGELLSRDTSYTYTATVDAAVYPVFLPTDMVSKGGPFSVGNNQHMFWHLAVADAMKTGSTVVLNRNFTLPSTLAEAGLSSAYTDAVYTSGTDGNITYTIPAGVTFLIPFDSGNTLYGATPGFSSTWTKPTEYRVLTMETGAHIAVNGSMNLSAKHRAGSASQNGSSATTGPSSFVKMDSGSTITVNSGGFLYAWGFITGAAKDSRGSVTINSGGSVYEYFQFQDYRGGSQTFQMKNKVFAFNQYFVQNVEVPLTLHAGAKESVYATISVGSGVGDKGLPVQFIGGSESMFDLKSGYLVKEYVTDENNANGRLKIEVYGNMEVSATTVEVVPLVYYLKTGDSVLPINGSFSITVKNGNTLTLGQDVCFLPGAEVTIEENAKVVIGSGKKVYFYDLDQWGNYCGSVNKPYMAIAYAPGGTTNPENYGDAKLLINGTVDATAGSLYTTDSGAQIYSTKYGVFKTSAPADTTTYQLVQGTGYTSINANSAVLRNGDGTDCITEGNGTKTYTYHKEHQRWYSDTHAETSHAAQSATCTEIGWDAYVTCPCGYTTYHEIDALGHSYGDWVVTTEPTCTVAGVETRTCTTCGGTETQPVNATGGPHEWGKVTDDEGKTITVCSACQTKLVFQVSMAVNDSLDLIFSIRQSDLAGLEDKLICNVTKQFADGRADVVQPFTFDSNTPVSEDGYYRLRFSDISAKEMMDNITAVISYTDGRTDPELISCSTSVQGYVHSLYDYFADPNDKTKNAAMFTALADLLNYGAACQIHFGYDDENLANTGNDDLMENATPVSEAAEAQSTAPQANDPYYYGTSFSAKNNLMFTFYYDFQNEIEPAKVTADVIIVDRDGKVIATDTVFPVKWYKRSAGGTTLHGIDITGIPLSRGDVTINCTLSVDGQNISTVADSLASYASRASAGTLRNTMDALLRFTESANTYFS